MARSPSPDRRDRERSRRDGREQRRSRHDRDKRSRRDRSRSRSRSRDKSRSRSRDRKRRRDAAPTRSPISDEAGTPAQRHAHSPGARANHRERQPAAGAAAAVGAATEDLVEKRRKRIEAWQEQQRKLRDKSGEEDGHATTAAAQVAATAAATGTPEPAKQGQISAGVEATNGGAVEEEEEAREQQQQQKRAPSQESFEDNGGTSRKQWNLEDEDGLTDDDAPENVIAGITPGTLGGLDGRSEDGDQGLPLLPRLGELEKGPRATSDDEEEATLDVFLKQNATEKTAAKPPPAAQPVMAAAETFRQPTPPNGRQVEEEEEIDPLDAFMAAAVLPEVEKLKQKDKMDATAAAAQTAEDMEVESAAPIANGERPSSAVALRPRRGRPPSRYSVASDDDLGPGLGYSDEEDDLVGGSEDDDIEWAKKVQTGRLSKADKLGVTDHSEIEYPPFRRNFYIEVPELARMTKAEVDAYRKSLDGLKVRGQNVPKPLKQWTQAGLSARVLEVLRKSGFEQPLPIQAQALPVIMGGRDCIGIAKTGSGKTLAFVLPIIRHVKDQRPLGSGDGPIALIIAPTRELVTQIAREVKRFARVAGISCTSVYGGSGVANQISDLKRGCEVVCCTPGRMIDILATGNGRITNLRRVTFLVLDEADRMFDMGFEPQIMRIFTNVRPDRQTVLFSATFPRSVETLARQVLNNPVEIQLGGRSVVNPDIHQIVEIRREEERFLRLLELLGEWYERGKALIFVSSQDRCDTLFRDLLRVGYPCLSLHGGKDQSDRASTIADFKSDVCNVLVATSVAARGLDVRDLVLVVNYDPPNHVEDYVHRVGRTGRAGNKGTAVTFISPDEDQYAPDLVRALKDSGAPIPADLAVLSESFEKKRKAGLARAHGSGYGGSGYKFTAAEDDMVKSLKKAAARELGMLDEDFIEEADAEAQFDADGEAKAMRREEEEDDIREVAAATKPQPQATAFDAGDDGSEEAERTAAEVPKLSEDVQARLKAAQAVAEKYAAAAAAGATAPPSLAAVTAPPLQPPLASTSISTTTAPAITSMAPQQAQVSSLLAAAAAAAQRLGAATRPAFAAPPGPAGQPGAAPNIAAAAAAALQAMGITAGAPLPAALATAAAPKPHQALPTAAKHFETELEINDFPQQARWKVTHRGTISDIGERFGAAIVVKGRYVKPGAPLPEGERKLYLHVAGPTADIVRRAKAEIKHLLEESTEKAMRKDAPAMGRYTLT